MERGIVAGESEGGWGRSVGLDEVEGDRAQNAVDHLNLGVVDAVDGVDVLGLHTYDDLELPSRDIGRLHLRDLAQFLHDVGDAWDGCLDQDVCDGQKHEHLLLTRPAGLWFNEQTYICFTK